MGYRGFTGVLQVCYRGGTGMIQGWYRFVTGPLQGWYRGITGKLQWDYRRVYSVEESTELWKFIFMEFSDKTWDKS
jgi:hypothetical protein